MLELEDRELRSPTPTGDAPAMPLKVTFELSDHDLDYFRNTLAEVMQRRRRRRTASSRPGQTRSRKSPLSLW